jgi:curved DNA-binding protein CbpA
MTTKNFYQILGVDQNAEDSVIRAAHKALAQKYHPDKFSGNTAEAQARMVEINQAYAVLSDSQKRRDYDRDLASKANEPLEEDTPLNKEWRIACEYYPSLERLAFELSKLDSELTMEFRAKLATSKAFSSAAELAKQIENQYLSGYFGSNPELKAFAKEAILQGRRDVANEINQTLIALGDSITAEQLIDRMVEKYFPDKVNKQKERNAALKKEQERDQKCRKSDAFLSFVVFFAFLIMLFGFLILASIPK